MGTKVMTQVSADFFFKQYRATRFYRELYAVKGSVAGATTFENDRLRHLFVSSNGSSGCLFKNTKTVECSCALRVQVPRGLRVAVSILENNGYRIQLSDERLAKSVGWALNRTYIPVFVSSSNVVDIIQIVKASSRNRFLFRFEAVVNPGLQVKLTGYNKGVVQTPFHQDTHQLLYGLDNLWAYVDVPNDHVIMVSVITFDLKDHCVELFAADRSNETLAKVCHDDFLRTRATFYNTSLLAILVYSHNLGDMTLSFSFHNRSALPQKLPNASWNCSVPYLSDFLSHLSCNLEVECNGGDDEMACPYTSDLCGPGYLTLGEGDCFFYIWKWEVEVTWAEASDECLSHGGARLASLNSVGKWKDAVKVLPPQDVFLGLESAPSSLPYWSVQFSIVETRRDEKRPANILCERRSPSDREDNPKSIKMNGTSFWPRSIPSVRCPLGHYTHDWLACDAQSVCWRHHHFSQCESSQEPFLPSFTCNDQTERVPYTLMCDHRAHCSDGSDEDFCRTPPCKPGLFTCDNGQCIARTKVDDGWADCQNGDDERCCTLSVVEIETIPPPALITISGKGRLVSQSLERNDSTQHEVICPNTHFQCQDDGYCLPIFLRCNGVFDCPGREDETNCDECPGLYRCRASKICVHHSYMCDGHAQCPQHDDEFLCNATCPPYCVCRGLAFFCRQKFTASTYPGLRYLHAGESAMTPSHLTDTLLLIYLALARCHLVSLDGLVLMNLLTLDVHDNNLKTISHAKLAGVPQLRELSMAGNPLALVFQDVDGLRSFRNVLKLDLSRVDLHVLNVTALSAFPNLQVVNLSYSRVQRISEEGFGVLEQLRVIDVRGCPMTWFSREIFRGLVQLRTVYADNFKICCSAVLPIDFNLRNCFAPSDEISSCGDLLRGKGYSVCVFVLSTLALAGNSVSFIFRTYVSKRENKLGYGNFVTHLSVSDFLMGVYLAAIGLADWVHRGSYLWYDVAWRHSAACKLAGFLSFLSSEVSALIMCLITIDRFLVLRFPFSRLHFSPTSAHIASAIVWFGCVLFVSVPLLPVTSHWEFYSQTGICIPLPITRTYFAGHGYSFSIFIVFNFIVNVFISLGQLSIYWSIRANSMSAINSTKRTKDFSIARRLIAVAMTNFLCWFPVGTMGFMASRGLPIPGEVNVAAAIFVLPLNSAINPSLYTFNVIMERRSRAREDKLRALLLAQLKANK